MTQPGVIRLSQFINHPPARVWKALTDPALHAQWWAAGDVKPVVGHTFKLDMGKWGQQPCEVLAVEPERLLSYSFSRGMTITWRLAAEGAGTRLDLEHSGFDLDSPLGRQAYEGMGHGWPGVLARIEPALDAAGNASTARTEPGTMKHEIHETTFAARTYLVWHKEIEIRNITDKTMWQAAFGSVHAYVQKNTVQLAGPGTALYFRWDESAGKTELGIGNPVAGVGEVGDAELSLVSVATSQAAHATVKGGYEQLPEVHGQIRAHLREHGLTPTLAIEEYTVMAMDKPDPQDWETNVYYLHG